MSGKTMTGPVRVITPTFSLTGIGLAGYIVLIADDGRPGWHDDWDGTVHTTREVGETAMAEAGRAGYRAVLAAAVIIAEHADD